MTTEEAGATDREELVARVLEAGRRLGRAAVVFHTRVADSFGLGPADMKALDVVEQVGAVSPSDLAVRLGLTAASVTAMVDRLETKQLVRRVPHPTDRRRVLVEFAPEAMERMVPLYEGFVLSLLELLDRYDHDQLSLIEEACSEMAARQLRAAEQLDT